MKLLRRLVGWSCFLGLVAAVGVAVFHWVRYRPRFVMEGKREVVHLSEDGRFLLTCHEIEFPKDGGDRSLFFPVRLEVFDARAGTLVRHFDLERYPALSPDHRYLACTRHNDVVFFDWRTAEEWIVALDKDEARGDIEFSEQGRWLTITNSEPRSTVVVDVDARRVARRVTAPLLGFIRGESLAVCVGSKDRLELVKVETGQVELSLRSGIDLRGTSQMIASRDEKWLAVGQTGAAYAPLHPVRTESYAFRNAELWNLETGRKLVSFEPGRDNDFFISFSNDSRFYLTASVTGDNGVNVFQVDGARPIISLAAPHGYGAFSSDSLRLFVNHATVEQRKLVVIDLCSTQTLWENQSVYGRLIDSESTCVLCQDNWPPGRLRAFDLQTGVQHHEPATDVDEKIIVEGPPSHRSLVIVGKRKTTDAQPLWRRWLEKLRSRWFPETGTVIVATPSTGVELARFQTNSFPMALSADSSTLVTQSDLGEQCQIWTVHPHRAYFWAITWSLGVGAALLLLRLWRQTRRSRPCHRPAA